MKEAVVVAFGRSAIGKARGCFKNTRSDEIAAQVLKGVLDKIPSLQPEMIDDIILGCSNPEAEQGFNIARVITMRAGLPNSVPAQTINRFCSSGLQSIATGANMIMVGQADVVVTGGVETMSLIPMVGHNVRPNPFLLKNYPQAYINMGLTAEEVAEQYGVSRQEQDKFAHESHVKAAKAQGDGKFDSEIIPVKASEDPEKEVGGADITCDEGIRPDISLDSLSGLRTVFKENGTVTAGNASQMSDGAAMVVLMSAEKARELNIKPLAVFRSFASAGVDPEVMGIGPIKAIPKALEYADLELDQIDLFELNEAFASQAIACINELGLDKARVNVNGGAIALGHPLGCTGGFLTCKLLSEMKRQDKQYGMVSMCVGGGMGAAGVFERL